MQCGVGGEAKARIGGTSHDVGAGIRSDRISSRDLQWGRRDIGLFLHDAKKKRLHIRIHNLDNDEQTRNP